MPLCRRGRKRIGVWACSHSDGENTGWRLEFKSVYYLILECYETRQSFPEIGCLSRSYVAGVEHLRIDKTFSNQGEIFEELDDACDKILSQIVKMIDQADRWAIQSPKNPSHI
jgi:hypothetical protein